MPRTTETMTTEQEAKQRAMLRAMAGWLNNVADTDDMAEWVHQPLSVHTADAQKWAIDQWEQYT